MAKRDANAMDAALRRALSGGGAASGCDAELIAAWAEGRLARGERNRLESHIAACTPCRALATAMLDELAPAAAAPSPLPAWAWWRWRFAVPAMAGILVVGSAVYYQRDQLAKRQAPPALSVATPAPVAVPAETRPLQEAPPATVGGRLANRRDQPAASVEEKSDAIVVKVKTPAEAGLAVEGQLKQQVVTSSYHQSDADEPGKSGSELRKRLNEAREADKEVGANKMAASKDELRSAKVVEEPRRLSDANSAAKPPALLGAAAPSPQAPASFRPLRLSQPMAYKLPGDVPIRSVIGRGDRLWAVSDRGLIFRSSDQGQTWEKLDSPTAEDLVAIEWESETSLVVKDKKGNPYRLRP